MSTFPPPRVDITSKTWPSFADMLLRRWREGEHLGRVFFCAPLSHLGLAGAKRPPNSAPPPAHPLAYSGAEVRAQLLESDVVYTL